MSGHNKWAQIKHKKAITDKKRSQVFSKILRTISVAAKQEANPQFNPTLRSAIDKAKENNVPQENIERAIKKSQDMGAVEELLIEAYGPDGVAILVQAVTDNRNRTVAEIKKILSDRGGKWADPGSVMWAFDKTAEGWEAKFPQALSDASYESLESLMEALDDHDDVDELFTSAQLREHAQEGN
jgi:YebC/PmpR family DNA-binding regulatory protein